VSSCLSLNTDNRVGAKFKFKQLHFLLPTLAKFESSCNYSRRISQNEAYDPRMHVWMGGFLAH